MANTVKRYTVTFVPDKGPLKGARTLFFPIQGRYTWATEAEAFKRLRNVTPGLPRVLSEDELESLAVRPVECWEGHHDPVSLFVE